MYFKKQRLLIYRGQELGATPLMAQNTFREIKSFLCCELDESIDFAGCLYNKYPATANGRSRLEISERNNLALSKDNKVHLPAPLWLTN